MAEPQITALLERWGRGDASAFEQLIPLVYDELRRIARNYMRKERGNHTLQATAIVHEAMLRLSGSPVSEWQNRSQFYGISAQLMRRVLVDHARQSLAVKRGGSS